MPFLKCRSTNHQFADGRVALVVLEHRANPDQRQPHVDIETIELRLAHILRMRIIRFSENGQKCGYDFLFGLLTEIAQELLITLRDHRNRSGYLVSHQRPVEHFALDPVAPNSIGISRILRPRRLVPAQLHRAIA